ncbi:penicillin-binding protein 2 [Candidatus Oleimmundimicrobium sp.]|uniref:penicillin-binding protein 2 n=1 Tax=Candidatus Oleimmundimicrobium sp. TaxID=3060597 RepID=UPI00271DEBF4|nr:penicillin-binding protein 2 [Candidatus Oleimmundimicrobium sp.]MDO8886141.1 penicillin-binding protein 2 [Candidatus Oleimmundimicrobium sp.]
MVRFDDSIQKRLAIAGVIVIIAFGVLLGRLWTLQIIAGEKYFEMAESNRVRTVSISASRGVIYDRNGEILVNNRPSLVVTVIPSELKNKDVLLRLSELLDMVPNEIEEKLEDKKVDPLKPRTIKYDINEDTAVYIKEHSADFLGVEVKVEPVRNYSTSTVAAHVLGYLGEISEDEFEKMKDKDYKLGDLIGKSGTEKQYEEILCGVRGFQQLEVDASGKVIRILDENESVAGNNLQLTIDNNLQLATEKSLQEAIKAANKEGYKDANAGAALVMNPNTGEILAMASYPTFDPSLFTGGISSKQWAGLNDETSGFPLLNRTMMCSYAPGSVFKPITYLAGLMEGVISYNSTFNCTGKWTGMGESWARYCWKRSGHGQMNLSSGLSNSCDVVFYEIGYKLYKEKGEKLQKWAREFNLGSKTGIDLPSETKGRVPDKAWKKKFNENYPEYQAWMPGDTVNLAIGQGDLLTSPLQIASVYSAIANGGTVWKPHLGKNVLTAEGEEIHEFKKEKVLDIPVPKTIIEKLQKDLRRVIVDGTAKNAFAGFPIKVAGKTGTSQVKSKDDFAWFACYAPLDKPQYVVVVLIEQGGHGGSIAAPAARRILAAVHDIPSTGPVTVLDRSR